MFNNNNYYDPYGQNPNPGNWNNTVVPPSSMFNTMPQNIEQLVQRIRQNPQAFEEQLKSTYPHISPMITSLPSRAAELSRRSTVLAYVRVGILPINSRRSEKASRFGN